MLEVHSLSLGMVRAYLLSFDQGLILIDAGMPGYANRVLRKMAALGRRELGLIYITHAHIDHYGSAAALRRATGASIAIHHADEDAMSEGKSPLGEPRGRGRIVSSFMPLAERLITLEPTKPDIVVHDGDSLGGFGLDARVLHTPGHTSGSSSLIVDDKYAFVGDLLSTGGKPHAQRLFAKDWSVIEESINRVRSAEPEWIYAGHGKRPISYQELSSIEVD
jgi:glyoxylase-like metal-dependent hydrolase (beta-lactamase superfamily II)